MSSIPYLKIKKRCLVYYSLPEQKRYNEKSKENLLQNTIVQNPKEKKELAKLSDNLQTECINEHAKIFLEKYEQINKKSFKSSFSRTQQKKISDSTNTFIDAVANNYRKANGLNQRMITFVTLTIPEKQKHTDKVLVKTLIDFIDHLKKVKNTLIENKEDTGKELLKLENYIWRAETTEAGNIHFHLLFDTYVNHITLKRVWNNYLCNLGYTGGENSANIHNLKNVKDVGGYVTKYLTKEPLNNEFNELLKTGQITHSDLQNYEPSVKFRRPVLYRSWGCSRVLKKLSAPTFSGSKVIEFNELRDKCQKVELNDDIKDFIKIYKGKIYDLVSKCSKKIGFEIRSKLKSIYDFIYKMTEPERVELENTIWLSKQILKDEIQKNHFNPVREKFIIPQFF